MRKLTYWVAECLNDSTAYSIRRKTYKEVCEDLKGYDAGDYGEPKKVSVEYSDAFDLMNECMNEARGYWEA